MVYYSRPIISANVMSHINPSTEDIRNLLHAVRTVAIIGLSPNETRPSFRVASGLQSVGYRIIPVRPLLDQVLGEKAFPNLESLPELPDIVDVFRAAEHVPGIVESCIKLGVKNLWLQEGVIHEAAAQRAGAAGITVVMNRCMWRDYMQLCHNQTQAKSWQIN
jgi:predicted CoA-binding protein